MGGPGRAVILVIARFRPRADRRDDLLALLRDVQAASRADDGCLNYGYYEEIDDASSFVAVEEWRDMDALRSHLRQPHIARLIAALPDAGDGPPEIRAYDVEGSVPMPLPGR
jgi:quinol monooxygenase YgiN